MIDTWCPYCKTDLEINHDDGYGYGEDEIYEQECGSCGKTFIYTTSISFHYEAYKADCLNGVPHKWKPMTIYPPLWANAKRCEDCSKEDRGKQTMTLEEHQKQQ